MILYRYILKNHLWPFVFAVFTLTGIFLLQFLMKFADRLVGKGLGFWIVSKLIVYNLAWIFVLVIPMSVLISALMAFGNMSQQNEITIMKATGTSLYKMILLPLAASIVIAFLLFLFNNYVLPDANHKAKILMEDISRKKPTLSLEPGVFSMEVNNYAILVKGIEKNSNKLLGVKIYDYSSPTKLNIVTAREGKIFFSKDQSKLIMDLKSGEIHEADTYKKDDYKKVIFTNHRITMDASQFTFQQSGMNGPRGDRELSTEDMNLIVDSLTVLLNDYKKQLADETNKFFFIDSEFVKSAIRFNKLQNKNLVYERALENIRVAQNVVFANSRRVEVSQNRINEYLVEIHKKYALPAACIVFLLIGAPLGVMVRKGGFGTAGSISLFFFILYWAFLIGGEKLGNRGLISPFWGMWAANVVIGISGILLTIKTVKETLSLDFSSLKKIIPKQLLIEQENEDS